MSDYNVIIRFMCYENARETHLTLSVLTLEKAQAFLSEWISQNRSKTDHVSPQSQKKKIYFAEKTIKPFFFKTAVQKINILLKLLITFVKQATTVNVSNNFKRNWVINDEKQALFLYATYISFFLDPGFSLWDSLTWGLRSE